MPCADCHVHIYDLRLLHCRLFCLSPFFLYRIDEFSYLCFMISQRNGRTNLHGLFFNRKDEQRIGPRTKIAFFLGLVYFITPHVFVCLTIRTLNPLVIEIWIFFPANRGFVLIRNNCWCSLLQYSHTNAWNRTSTILTYFVLLIKLLFD